MNNNAHITIEEAICVMRENGKHFDIMDFDDILDAETLDVALEHVTRLGVDVFSYNETANIYRTFLGDAFSHRLIAKSEEVLFGIIQFLLDDAKKRGVLEKCARSPAWITVNNELVIKPLSLMLQSDDLIQFAPSLLICEDGWWCKSVQDRLFGTFYECIQFGRERCYAFFLDTLRPRRVDLPQKVYATALECVLERYISCSEASLAVAWCFSRKNMGGVWEDLQLLVAERWDYRVDAWEPPREKDKTMIPSFSFSIQLLLPLYNYNGRRRAARCSCGNTFWCRGHLLRSPLCHGLLDGCVSSYVACPRRFANGLA